MNECVNVQGLNVLQNRDIINPRAQIRLQVKRKSREKENSD